ncbi:MAG TPA: hypothetical protein VMM13_10510 [Euzebya sp.]|nr:hypothetical protein [Euzebya sp.]
MPVSRLAGRATGRWWRRCRGGAHRINGPVRHGWATGVAYAWFVAYMWIGLLLSVAGQRLTGVNSPYVLMAAVGGGGVLGYWQARHRLRRHADPSTPQLQRFGLGLCAWLGVIGAALLLTSR